MTDAELLDWLADNDVIEGFAGVEQDIHEIACELSDARVNDLAVRHSYRRALREMIRRAAAASSKRSNSNGQ